MVTKHPLTPIISLARLANSPIQEQGVKKTTVIMLIVAIVVVAGTQLGWW